MIELKPYDARQQQIHEDNLWIKSECYRFYAQQRRIYCNLLQLLDLWVLAPYCEDCINNDPLEFNRIPEIMPNQWELDFICEVGGGTLERIQKELSEDRDFTLHCKSCFDELAPWNGDEVYVVRYHLEEHYGIPLFTPNRKKPPKKLQEQIFKLYDYECFECGAKGIDLHIDHIVPRSRGGDAAFRNLQPLCKRCRNIKGNYIPEVVEVWNTSYFGPYPSDSYEHMFW